MDECKPLVPGAHAGRGRGNSFLNDLCDADVLIHVVDASGRSDREGVDLTGGGHEHMDSGAVLGGGGGGGGGGDGDNGGERAGGGEGGEGGDVEASSSAAAAAAAAEAAEAAAAAAAAGGGDPAGDVQWVREEIHAWIFGNVRKKWRAVRKKPERLHAMFTGYHCVRGTVDIALLRMVGSEQGPVK